MLGVLHIDKVDNDYATQIAHTDLPRRGRSGFEIGFIDGLLKIAMPHKGASVYIYGGHGLGLIYNQMSTRFEGHIPLQRLANFVFDPMEIKQRALARIMFHQAGNLWAKLIAKFH